MKVIQLSKDNQSKLQDFLPQIAEGKTRPGLYIGIDNEGDAVLYLADLTWKELAYVKTAFDMHVTRDWLGLMDNS